MKVIEGKLSGFCGGVTNAITKALEIVDKNSNVYSLGELVHNERVIADLEAKGMKTVESITEIPNGSNVIFRAHGEAEAVFQEAIKKELTIFDLTCIKVKLIHEKIKNKNDAYTIVIGKKKHPEVVAHAGYLNAGCVIESEEDIVSALNDFKKSDKEKIYVVAQTTFNENEFKKIIDLIIKSVNCEVLFENTICNATHKRQMEVVDLSKKVDAIIIVGGKNSSNTKELYNLAINNNKNAYLIQDENDLDKELIKKCQIIGLMGGASTPRMVLDKIKKIIEDI